MKLHCARWREKSIRGGDREGHGDGLPEEAEMRPARNEPCRRYTQEQRVQRARGSCVSGRSQEPQEAGVHAVHQVQGESEGTSSGLECSGSHGLRLL